MGVRQERVRLLTKVEAWATGMVVALANLWWVLVVVLAWRVVVPARAVKGIVAVVGYMVIVVVGMTAEVVVAGNMSLLLAWLLPGACC